MRLRALITSFLVFVQWVSSMQAQNASDSASEKSKKKLLFMPRLEKSRTSFVQNKILLRMIPDAIAAGGNLYEQHCAECHGSKAEGRRKRGPSLTRLRCPQR